MLGIAVLFYFFVRVAWAAVELSAVHTGISMVDFAGRYSDVKMCEESSENIYIFLYAKVDDYYSI